MFTVMKVEVGGAPSHQCTSHAEYKVLQPYETCIATFLKDKRKWTVQYGAQEVV